MTRAKVAATVAMTLILTGCAVSPAAKPSHTPTPTPTPTIMSTAEAGLLYLQAVCPSNLINGAFQKAWDGNNIKTLHAEAQLALDADTAGAKILDSGLWPENVKADIGIVRDSLFGSASTESEIINSPTMDTATSIAWPDNSASGAASQRVRSRLGLPANALQGCATLPTPTPAP